MNDLSKKEETQLEEKAKASSSSTLLRKRLESYLLLLYQGYLKGETDMAPEIRSVFLNFVKQDEALAFKVRMLQLDYLNLEHVELEGAWNETTETLFPEVEAVDKPLVAEREKILSEYKEIILEMLNSSSELRS